MILRCAKTYLKAQCAIGVRDEVAVGRAAALFEVGYGLIRLPAITCAVDFVCLSIAAVASLLLHQPHLQWHILFNLNQIAQIKPKRPLLTTSNSTCSKSSREGRNTALKGI